MEVLCCCPGVVILRKLSLMRFRILSPILLAAVFFLLIACNNGEKGNAAAVNNLDTALIDGHPAWIMQGNIYEVNVRQYTPEGTFNAFSNHLQRLKDMGVQTLWFMPINPISKLDRKGVLGSYYAVADYTGINPEFGTLADWKNLVEKAHGMGFKVIIDWVPNHTGADHHWLSSHPDFYVRDSATGKVVSPFDWTDTRKLNYANPVMVDSMIQCMKYWLKETNIDGFRCDVAGEVPDSFWKKCITELKQTKPGIFMLAEGDKASLHNSGFDASYPWSYFALLKKVATGERSALAIDSLVAQMDTTFPANAIRMFFTSNHDENSWNKADYATMPGPKHAPFAVLTQTMKGSVPLIYSGQEEPVADSISFFYKDTISFQKLERSAFYKTLLELRKNNPALAANASFKRISVGDDKALYAFVRAAGDKKILVILNLSDKEQTVTVADYTLYSNPLNLFMGTQETVSGKPFGIEPWGYIVYVY